MYGFDIGIMWPLVQPDCRCSPYNLRVADWNPIARLLVFVGAGLIVLGVLVQVALRLFPSLGRLPGDIVIDRGNGQVYIPIVTMIIISIVLTLLLNLIGRFFNNR
jgi:hypothetical protein